MLMKLPTISMKLNCFSRHAFIRSIPLMASVVLSCVSQYAYSKVPVTIEREDPRLFGYQLGDVITESAYIGLASGYHFDPQSLPTNGKRAGWFMVRSSHYEEQALADGSAIGKLTIDFQLINSPSNVRSLTIPPISLKFKGPQNLVDTLPSLTIDAAPLDTGEVRTGLPDAQPQRPAKSITTDETQTLLENLLFIAGIFGIWLIISLFIQRFVKRKTKPFAAAQRDIRRLSRPTLSIESAQTLAQRVHRAFDQSAGYRLFGEGVTLFCEQMNVPEELKSMTESFFETSQRLFFKEQSEEAAEELLSELPKQVRNLVRAWKKFEAKRRP